MFISPTVDINAISGIYISFAALSFLNIAIAVSTKNAVASAVIVVGITASAIITTRYNNIANGATLKDKLKTSIPLYFRFSKSMT